MKGRESCPGPWADLALTGGLWWVLLTIHARTDHQTGHIASMPGPRQKQGLSISRCAQKLTPAILADRMILSPRIPASARDACCFSNSGFSFSHRLLDKNDHDIQADSPLRPDSIQPRASPASRGSDPSPPRPPTQILSPFSIPEILKPQCPVVYGFME